MMTIIIKIWHIFFFNAELFQIGISAICHLVFILSIYIYTIQTELYSVVDMKCRLYFRVYFSFKGAALCWHWFRLWICVTACTRKLYVCLHRHFHSRAADVQQAEAAKRGT